MARPFYIVDVFAETPYAGNPLAVILQSDGLSDKAMQRIAAETNYSETTFVDAAPRDGAYRVRIFTPARELQFAGHPILGTAWVIRQHVVADASAPIALDILAGRVPVTFERDADGRAETSWFLAPPAELGATCAPEPMAAALGIDADDIDAKSPIQQYSSGTSALIVPLRDLNALRRCRLDLERFAPLAERGLPPLVYCFCTETRSPGNDVSARFFFDAHGVREDPATGNGAAFLGAYLLRYPILGSSSVSLRIEQGFEMGRPSLVRVNARRLETTVEVHVGGRVIPIVSGELL